MRRSQTTANTRTELTEEQKQEIREIAVSWSSSDNLADRRVEQVDAQTASNLQHLKEATEELHALEQTLKSTEKSVVKMDNTSERKCMEQKCQELRKSVVKAEERIKTLEQTKVELEGHRTRILGIAHTNDLLNAAHLLYLTKPTETLNRTVLRDEIDRIRRQN